MKKQILLLFLIATLGLQAQTEYWTSYNFVVEPQNVQAVYNLVDSYYKANKPAGVSVRLFENHFKDAENNYSHCIVFSGSLDALGAMYGSSSAGFDLFLTQVNQQIKTDYSSSMGSGVAAYMGGDGPFPFRRMFMVKAENPAAYEAAFKKFQGANNPNGRMIFLGRVEVGTSDEGETHFIIAAFKTFKAAMAGVMDLVPANERAAYQKAWAESNAEGGQAEILGSSMRILLGEW